MNDEQVADYQKSAATGHRPTWSMGVHGSEQSRLGCLERRQRRRRSARNFKGCARKSVQAARNPRQERRRVVVKGAKKHLQALNLDEDATADEIKIQFKALVKLHHPDHNGGDRSSEERFREVLTAYNYLKQAGLVR